MQINITSEPAAVVLSACESPPFLDYDAPLVCVLLRLYKAGLWHGDLEVAVSAEVPTLVSRLLQTDRLTGLTRGVYGSTGFLGNDVGDVATDHRRLRPTIDVGCNYFRPLPFVRCDLSSYQVLVEIAFLSRMHLFTS